MKSRSANLGKCKSEYEVLDLLVNVIWRLGFLRRLQSSSADMHTKH